MRGNMRCANFIRNSLHPFLELMISCLLTITVATKIRCYPLVTGALEKEFHDKYSHEDLEWIGKIYSCLSLLLIPLCTGFLELSGMSYRAAIVLSGLLQMIGCLTSSGVNNPSYLILSDSLVTAVGSALLLSTTLLVTDDNFPTSSSCRVFTTSLVQGTSFGSFFFSNLISSLIVSYTWRVFFTVLGVSIGVLSLLAFIIISDSDNQSRCFPILNRRISLEDDDIIDNIKSPGSWKFNMLGISNKDFHKKESKIFSWLCERFLCFCLTDGLFLYLLASSDMINSPYTIGSTTISKDILVVFMFSIGDITMYFLGSIVGSMNMMRGKLIKMYAGSSALAFFVIIFWQFFLYKYKTVSMYFSWVSGGCIGLLNTAAYAASEEVTGVPARKMYPFTKIMAALSVLVTPLLSWIVSQKTPMQHAGSIHMIFYSVIAALDFCAVIFILHITGQQKVTSVL